MAESPIGLSILVVDDHRTSANALVLVLKRAGHRPVAVYDGQSAIERLEPGVFDLVLTDLRMEPVDGLEVVRAARALSPAPAVLVFTAYGSVSTAVEAMRLGASDFLTKPVSAEEILRQVARFGAVAPPPPEVPWVAQSPAGRALFGQLQEVVGVRSPVLLLGEAGSGRSHAARWLHAHGPDAHLPFQILRVHPGLVANELFGNGALLLPRVDTLNPAEQNLLLRLLDTLPPGEPPRLLATAAESALEDARSGRILPELYLRLAVLVLRVPPLRERASDVGPLLHLALESASKALQRPAPALSEPLSALVGRLERHPWSGNVRELVNFAERAVATGVLTDEYLVGPMPTAPAPQGAALHEGFQLSAHLEEIERAILQRAHEQTGGDRAEMGRILGLERNTLRYKLQKYGLLG